MKGSLNRWWVLWRTTEHVNYQFLHIIHKYRPNNLTSIHGREICRIRSHPWLHSRFLHSSKSIHCPRTIFMYGCSPMECPPPIELKFWLRYRMNRNNSSALKKWAFMCVHNFNRIDRSIDRARCMTQNTWDQGSRDRIPPVGIFIFHDCFIRPIQSYPKVNWLPDSTNWIAPRITNTIGSPIQPTVVKSSLFVFEAWCEHSGLNLNTPKCSTIIFTGLRSFLYYNVHNIPRNIIWWLYPRLEFRTYLSPNNKHVEDLVARLLNVLVSFSDPLDYTA